ncbi:HU family DNA-binding protein [Acidithiobacillus sulfuriphilus]|uniref:DNA-binding protein n=1 Tax=Acidithiobacillus sulfuriphilus TaxID=1867749 RepID=A0A3M8QZX5_9PROT|nr:hypothetical protein EC580_08080 [Acidithiobacillus sulfuriphilus]
MPFSFSRGSAPFPSGSGLPARAGRNPRTGKPVAVPQRRRPLFKAGKELRKAV